MVRIDLLAVKKLNYLCSSNNFFLGFVYNIEMFDLIPKEMGQGTTAGFALNGQSNANEDKCGPEHVFYLVTMLEVGLNSSILTSFIVS